MSDNLLKNYLITVDEQENGSRLDKYLANHFQELSRTRIQDLISGGHVLIDGHAWTTPSTKVKTNQRLELTVPALIEAIPQPQDIPLEIIYEDSDVIVINKPAGMVVHPAPGHFEGTLVNALLNHCGDSLSGINGVKRPGIVHRLDKDTSGLIIAAKNDKAHQGLSKQLSSHDMGRIYHALVWGMMSPMEGIIEGAIGRDPHNRQKMSLKEKGKFAKTHYKVLKYFGRTASLIECRLETGRTHQIRVHLTSKNHPLIGDSVYGKPPKGVPVDLQSYLKENWIKGRQALHATELAFIHPRTREKMHFTVNTPKDMRNLIDVLNSYYLTK